ncbi:unnamed protein product [Mytilus coruscus]|uniref:Uncharacterized protein n=1 Tax=Mytilus coruscus TaxID=42192 RepID=A0A6J8ADF8_MYTCO|nr:unnamed protein product [Mytilus coruscus]
MLCKLASLCVELTRVIKKGDHVVAIGDNDQDDWQHGIFIGTSEGIVNFGTEKQSVSEIEDLLTFVKNRSLVRINYKMKCLDPLETSYFAQQKEYFVPRDSAAHNAIKCKIGKSEPNEILRLLPKNIQSLMQKANQPDILQLLRKCIDEILWFWK